MMNTFEHSLVNTLQEILRQLEILNSTLKKKNGLSDKEIMEGLRD